MTSGNRPSWLLPVVFVLLSFASLAPIRSNDYFWHLATGRWIVEHHALPLSDPFAVASSREPWINDEWLFETALYPLYATGGHAAVSIVLALTTAALFSWLLTVAAADAGLLLAIPLTFVSWYGAEGWLRERPATAGAICLGVLVTVLLHARGRTRLFSVFAICVLWMNLHPSALIAPVVVALCEAGEAIEVRSRARWNRPWPLLASVTALFINPFGLRGVSAPFRLTGMVQQFHNAEWAPSLPAEFPLFYAVVAGAILLFAFAGRRSWPRMLLFLFLALLAVRYSRNQGLFFVTLPLLLAPAMPPASIRIQRLAVLASILAFLAVLSNAHLSTGIDERKFPVSAVAALRASGLQGNIYNTYGTGGFLIWSFLPARRVVTDGRNELYLAYNAEHERALRDGKEWQELFRRYDLRLAVFDYHRPAIGITDPGTGRVVKVPQAVAYFPPKQWALIGVDPVAMVFARRDAFSPEVLARLEVR
jgi:hypothetical protein